MWARNRFLSGVLLLVCAGVCVAQFRQGRGRGVWLDEGGSIVQTEGGVLVNEETVRTARETVSHSTDTPVWTNAPGFERDVFTYTRVIFKSYPGRPSWFGWVNDYPDSDLNLSFRLQQLTSLKVDPDGRVVKLTDPAIHRYPLLNMTKPGRIRLDPDEVEGLRKYLHSGGTLMADDFWGTSEWDNFEAEMKQVLPERSWEELPIEHPLFHCVYDFKLPKNKLQVPYIRLGQSSLNPNSPLYGQTSQNGADSEEVHIRAWHDDRGRIMIIATHNTNNGDGWEREGEDTEYFREYSENRAYPLAIDIIYYIMTH